MVERNNKSTVLAAAVAMFADRGYTATGMRELGAELGITARALYRHFPDKDALFLAATGQLLADIDALISHPPSDDTSDRLAWVTRYTEALRAQPAVTRIVGAEIAWAHHQAVGPRARAQDSAVRRILAGPGPDPDTRGGLALGLLWWPIICLHEPPDETAEQSAQRAVSVAATSLPSSPLRSSPPAASRARGT